MEIDRSKRPQPYPEITFSIPKISEFKLDNGLRVLFSEKNTLPIVRISLLTNSGSRFDPENFKGLSNLLTLCIDEGAGKLSALELADEFEMLGAQFSVASDSDISIISLQVLKENFIPALKLFKSVIVEPHLKPEDFRREQGKVVVRLNQVKAEPDYIADVSFERFLFGSSCPYSFPVMGVEKDIKNISNKQVKEFYDKKFYPANSTLIVVGNIDRTSLFDYLQEEFGNWQKASVDNSDNLLVGNENPRLYIINKPDSVQTEIRTGHLTSKRNTEDFLHKQLLNLVIGGQFSSRLNLNLREKHGYTYGVHSSFIYFKDAGYFSVNTSVSSDNTANALREILSEIRKAKEGISKEELEFAKSSLSKRFPANFETFRQISSNIGSKVIHNLPDDYFETYLAKLNAINLDGINSIAENSVYPEKLLTVLVGDSKKILEQVNKENFGAVEILKQEDIFN
jgi:zinc protease